MASRWLAVYSSTRISSRLRAISRSSLARGQVRPKTSPIVPTKGGAGGMRCQQPEADPGDG
jgi:hypothetical protein